MKVIIAGSRDITDPSLVAMAVEESGFVITELVCGKARGVDSLGEQWAIAHGVAVREFIPDWDGLGRKAGILRNEEMGRYADALIAVWDGVSRGTRHMIEFMQKLGKYVYVYNTSLRANATVRIPAERVRLRRATIGAEPGLDITVKSAQGMAKAFAPTWDMVRGHQARQIDNSTYTSQYIALLEALPIDAWRWLTNQRKDGTLTVLCYCPELNSDGGRKFCHTHILIDHMLRRWPQFFCDDREK